MDYELVNLSEDDRQAVVAIFNHFVSCSFAAYPEERVTEQFFDRLLAMCDHYPAVVVRTKAGKTAGFGLLHAFHAAPTFRRTAEITYFLLPEYTRQGIGSRILTQLAARAQAMGIDNLIASVSSLNEQSLRFHTHAGFERCGTLRAVGTKFGRDFDVILFQKRLNGGEASG
jgi:phosphinothricin acetyltransferase